MDKNKKKISVIIYFFIALAAFAALMTAAAFFDYDISVLLADLKEGEYYSSNGFARFFEVFGEIPLYIFLCYAFAVVFWNAFYFGKPVVRYTVCAVCIAAVALCCYVVPARIHGYLVTLGSSVIEGKLALAAFEVITGMFIGMSVMVGVMFTGKENIRTQFSVAVIILFVAAFSQAAAQGIKAVNKRVRFRAINVYGGEFTPWYRFNGYPESFRALVEVAGTKDAIKSFPSGHTTAAGIVFAAFAFPFAFRNLSSKRYSWMFFALPFLYAITVAVARIIMGAHYLSDVTFGFCLALLPSLFAVWLVYEKNAVKPLSVYCGINR